MKSNANDIIFFGDSLTFGYGVSKENSWVYKLVKNNNLSSANQARNGETTTSMLVRYDTDVLKYHPSVIFIMGGTNDLLLGRSVGSVVDNIELMIKDGLKINSQILLGIPPNIIGTMTTSLFSPSYLYTYAEKELINLKNNFINLCEKYKIPFIDFYTITLNRNDIYLDGIHLNNLGHDLMYKKAAYFFKFN